MVDRVSAATAQCGLLPSSEQTGRGAVANPRALRCRRHAARWNGRLHRDVERAGAGDSLGVAGGQALAEAAKRAGLGMAGVVGVMGGLPRPGMLWRGPAGLPHRREGSEEARAGRRWEELDPGRAGLASAATHARLQRLQQSRHRRQKAGQLLKPQWSGYRGRTIVCAELQRGSTAALQTDGPTERRPCDYC